MPGRKRELGTYEIVRQIARGGMAVVYLARQTTLDRDVALKELSTFYAQAPDMAERFLHESKLAGSLNHPNIVTVLEYFEHAGIPYIAMEYLPRGSLRPLVGKLSFAHLVGVMEGVLSGLDHAGAAGVVHRDLKPENLLVTNEGRIKITDFGIAKATESAMGAAFATATGTTVGTPAYMAPEQAMAQTVGLSTDLYSVGVMAWEHVVGRTPFHETEAPMAVLMRHIQEEIPPVIEVNSTAHPDLSQWIGRLLVKDPDRRTRSAAEAWDELEEIVIGQLGPRWRHEARLPTQTMITGPPRPLTPAPFESQRAKSQPPVAQAEGATPEASDQPPVAGSHYVTFRGDSKTTEPNKPEAAPREPAHSPEPAAAMSVSDPPATPAAMTSQVIALGEPGELPPTAAAAPERRPATARTAAGAAQDAEPAPADVDVDRAPPPERSAVGSARRSAIARRNAALGGIVAVLASVAVIVVATGGSSGGDRGVTKPVTAVNHANDSVPIPAGNLTKNASFERNLSSWDTSNSRLSRLRAPDAPNGHYVVRVSALKPSDDFAIDDHPDTVGSSIAGHRYVAQAWVKGTGATDGKRVCLGLRERAGPQDDLVGQAYGGDAVSAARYREVRVAYVAKHNGDRVDVHMFTDRPAGNPGDAFLADAISITQSSGGPASPEC